jgi:hypothetical protein
VAAGRISLPATPIFFLPAICNVNASRTVALPLTTSDAIVLLPAAPQSSLTF